MKILWHVCYGKGQMIMAPMELTVSVDNARSRFSSIMPNIGHRYIPRKVPRKNTKLRNAIILETRKSSTTSAVEKYFDKKQIDCR
jgi:hypothetical protein